jgi:hypothetical protein
MLPRAATEVNGSMPRSRPGETISGSFGRRRFDLGRKCCCLRAMTTNGRDLEELLGHEVSAGVVWLERVGAEFVPPKSWLRGPGLESVYVPVCAKLLQAACSADRREVARPEQVSQVDASGGAQTPKPPTTVSSCRVNSPVSMAWPCRWLPWSPEVAVRLLCLPHLGDSNGDVVRVRSAYHV